MKESGDPPTSDPIAGGPDPGSPAERAALLRRLHRLQGQAAGIVRMIEADRPAPDVLQQFSALSAATREASVAYALTSLRAQLGGVVEERTKLDEILAEVRIVLERTTRLP